MTELRYEQLDEDWQRGLAVVAHPDDLEYGVASAISKWTSEGKEFTYLLATRGEAGIDAMHPGETRRVRTQEEIDSAKVVGVDTVEFLDYPDGMVEYGLPLRRDIARAIRQHKPDVVVTMNFEMRFRGGGTNQSRPSHRRACGAGCEQRRRESLDLHGVERRWAGAVERSQDGAGRCLAKRHPCGGRGGSHLPRSGVVGEARHLHQWSWSGLRPRDVPDYDGQCRGRGVRVRPTR